MQVKKIPLAVAAIIGISAAVLGTRASISSDGKPAAQVLPASATAEQVVTRYLEALKTGDSNTARTLSTEHFKEIRSSLGGDSLFAWENISSVQTMPPFSDQYGGPEHYSQTVRVWAKFLPKSPGEKTVSNGTGSWSYLLARNSGSEPWLIADDGMG